MGEHEIIIDRVFAPEVSAAAWSRGLAAWERGGHPGRELKHDAATLVMAAQMAGRPVVVKRWSLDGLSKLKASLGAGRGQRHWAGAAWLARHKIATAPCLVLGHAADAGRRRDYLVMECLDGPTVLEVLRGARRRDAREMPRADAGAGRDPGAPAAQFGGRAIGIREELAIARELGRQISHMIAHGRFNRDHKPSNLIVVRRAGGMRVAVVDCVAILPLSRGGGAGQAVERMLASLVIEPLGDGVPPRRSLALATLRAVLGLERGGGAAVRQAGKRRMRGLWMSIAARVSAHGDPTPKVKPLV